MLTSWVCWVAVKVTFKVASSDTTALAAATRASRLVSSRALIAVTVVAVETGGVVVRSVTIAAQSVFRVAALACRTFCSAVNAQGGATVVALLAQAKSDSNVEV